MRDPHIDDAQFRKIALMAGASIFDLFELHTKKGIAQPRNKQALLHHLSEKDAKGALFVSPVLMFLGASVAAWYARSNIPPETLKAVQIRGKTLTRSATKQLIKTGNELNKLTEQFKSRVNQMITRKKKGGTDELNRVGDMVDNMLVDPSQDPMDGSRRNNPPRTHESDKKSFMDRFVDIVSVGKPQIETVTEAWKHTTTIAKYMWQDTILAVIAIVSICTVARFLHLCASSFFSGLGKYNASRYEKNKMKLMYAQQVELAELTHEHKLEAAEMATKLEMVKKLYEQRRLFNPQHYKSVQHQLRKYKHQLLVAPSLVFVACIYRTFLLEQTKSKIFSTLHNNYHQAKPYKPYDDCLANVDSKLHQIFHRSEQHNETIEQLRYHLLQNERKRSTIRAFFGFESRHLLIEHLMHPTGHLRESPHEIAHAIIYHKSLLLTKLLSEPALAEFVHKLFRTTPKTVKTAKHTTAMQRTSTSTRKRPPSGSK